MSLQPGINPLEAASMEEDRKRLERTMAARKFRQGMEVRDQHYSFPSAEEMEKRMGPGMIDKFGTIGSRQESSPIDKFGTVRSTPGMTNMGGFDPGDLMAAPKLRQDATMNQANMVSSPYFEANEKAAEKTNPMNAASQEPGKSFLMRFIGK